MKALILYVVFVAIGGVVAGLIGYYVEINVSSAASLIVFLSLFFANFVASWIAVIFIMDNFLKPYFISREGKLPFLLVFLGVLGGVLAFGFIGIFIGPVLLAIGFSLAKEWSSAGAEA